MPIAFALPSRADTGNGGGADYVDGLVAGLIAIGVEASLQTGPDPTFAAGAVPVVDGMLLPALARRLDELVERDAVALVHHIAAAAAGCDTNARDAVIAAERSMLGRLRRVVATSEPVAARLRSEFGIDAAVLPPGRRDAALATPDPASPAILSVGVLTPRKNHAAILQAAARLLDLPWHLTIAGDTQRDPAFADELESRIAPLGLTDRVTICRDPSPETLEQLWRRTTLFVSASRWEGYPGAIAEALARGIPVLATTTANATFLPLEAGAICPLDDMATFGKLLRRLLFDDPMRADMVAAARSAGAALPRWPDRARDFLSLVPETP